MAFQPDDRLVEATLSDAELRTVERFVPVLSDELGDDLQAVWLYGSRARGETPHEDSVSTCW
jgi:hypothetical protein